MPFRLSCLISIAQALILVRCHVKHSDPVTKLDTINSPAKPWRLGGGMASHSGIDPGGERCARRMRLLLVKRNL